MARFIGIAIPNDRRQLPVVRAIEAKDAREARKALFESFLEEFGQDMGDDNLLHGARFHAYGVDGGVEHGDGTMHLFEST